jgi:hypothetical protein
MKLSNKKLRVILRESIAECGEPMSHDGDHHVEHEPLEAIIDMLSKSDEPLSTYLEGKASMARGHLYHMAKRAQSLYDRLVDHDELPEWAQSKLAVAESMINAVYDHIDYKMHKHDQELSLSEINGIVREASADCNPEFISEAEVVPKLTNAMLVKSLKTNAPDIAKSIRPAHNAAWATAINTLKNMSKFDVAKFDKMSDLIAKHGLKANTKAESVKKPTDANSGDQAKPAKKFKAF